MVFPYRRSQQPDKMTKEQPSAADFPILGQKSISDPNLRGPSGQFPESGDEPR